MPRSFIACRLHSYAPFVERACAHLAELGVRRVEVELPPPDRLPALLEELNRHGLSASSVQGTCDLSRADVAEQIAAQMPAVAALGAPILFLSVKAGDLPPATAYERLRAAGDVAAAHDVTITLETHPDLITNADTALATMRGVQHPNVRVNYDTANIYFYNQGIDGVAELNRLLDYTASVHLKDTDGGYRHWHFPALGRGIVAFGRIFELLDKAGFAGPCTLEIEGIEGEQRTAQLVCDRVADSIDYLRGLGRL